MKLITGLGNPGPDYNRTRHNAGFLFLDHLAAKLGRDRWIKKFNSLFVTAQVCRADATLVKPMSYMNLSGGPVRAFMAESGVEPSGLLVIHDDIDLPFGDVRYKAGGGHGGHNGLKSILSALGSPDFHRIRIGVGRPPAGQTATDHVLDTFTRDEFSKLPEMFETAEKLMEEKFLKG
ncbi:MAG: aminoacyl-tRNA hydrolase [Nitrospinae bacterium]|nr:aminoacyl-tRNA hydrolase [Nitrospinota bacterium]MBF0635520.1 aminoacyl-tRNA hydrolase [Nitrospinota bacterium]